MNLNDPITAIIWATMIVVVTVTICITVVELERIRKNKK